MAFPIPRVYTSEAADIRRDEHKRIWSPPSFFFAQTQGLRLAAHYFNNERLLPSARGGVATKHRNRIRGALFGQIMAAFEFCIKDFIAQVLDATDMYDTHIERLSWIDINKSRVLAQRDAFTSVGTILIHPLLGWHDPETVNQRYTDLFDHEPIAPDEVQNLQRLWIVRHSVAHNAGYVTNHDAYRMRAPALGDQAMQIDEVFVDDSIRFLKSIICRIADECGGSLLTRWLRTRATGTWAEDKLVYHSIKQIGTLVESRARDLPKVKKPDYDSDLASTLHS